MNSRVDYGRRVTSQPSISRSLLYEYNMRQIGMSTGAVSSGERHPVQRYFLDETEAERRVMTLIEAPVTGI